MFQDFAQAECSGEVHSVRSDLWDRLLDLEPTLDQEAGCPELLQSSIISRRPASLKCAGCNAAREPKRKNAQLVVLHRNKTDTAFCVISIFWTADGAETTRFSKMLRWEQQVLRPEDAELVQSYGCHFVAELMVVPLDQLGDGYGTTSKLHQFPFPKSRVRSDCALFGS